MDKMPCKLLGCKTGLKMETGLNSGEIFCIECIIENIEIQMTVQSNHVKTKILQ